MRCVSITLVFLMFASVCFANYSIDWYTIDGGGGRSLPAIPIDIFCKFY